MKQIARRSVVVAAAVSATAVIAPLAWASAAQALPPSPILPPPIPRCPTGLVWNPGEADCEPAPPPPVARPTNVTVGNVTSHSATLSWTDSTQDESSFTVTRYQRQTAASPAQISSYVVPAPAGVSSFSLAQTDLQPLQTVQWSVVATASGKTPSAAVSTGTLTVDIPSGSPAASQLSAFRSDWQADAFPNVNKALVLADATRVVTNPQNSIDQGPTGACGPAAAEFELVKRDPARFVDTVRSIADTGAFTTPDGTTYTAHPELLASPVHPGLTEANWLFMATVKDSGNALRITAATGPDDAAWISSPADVDNWLAHIVGLHNTTATAIVRPFTWGETIMPAANSLLQNGGAVVLLVDSSLVGNPPVVLSSPNHYVNLLSWSSTSNTVTFTVATWGTVKTITTDWNTFDGLTWDVLTAS